MSQSSHNKVATPTPIESVFWLENMSSEASVGNVANTISGVYEDLEKNGFALLNEKLAQVNVMSANSTHLVAVLRSLYFMRKNLSNWENLRNKTCETLIARNQDGAKILHGLYKD